jgi:hypothetical protein
MRKHHSFPEFDEYVLLLVARDGILRSSTLPALHSQSRLVERQIQIQSE